MGGKNASLTPSESAAALLKVYQDLTTSDNGTFINYSGETINW